MDPPAKSCKRLAPWNTQISSLIANSTFQFRVAVYLFKNPAVFSRKLVESL